MLLTNNEIATTYRDNSYRTSSNKISFREKLNRWWYQKLHDKNEYSWSFTTPIKDKINNLWVVVLTEKHSHWPWEEQKIVKTKVYSENDGYSWRYSDGENFKYSRMEKSFEQAVQKILFQEKYNLKD